MGREAAMTVTAPLRNYVNRQFEKMDESWQSGMHLVQHRLLGDIEAASELTSTHARSLTLLNQRLDQLNERLDQLDERLSQLPESVAAAIRSHAEGSGTTVGRHPRAPRET
jgi:hypothetical protein